ncbi:glutathionylspermidine synthase family protein [Pseudomonas luteola]
MKAVYHDIGFNIDEIVQQELPKMSAFHADNGELRWDVHDLFQFPVDFSSEMPFYTISEANADKAAYIFEDTYHMLVEAAGRAFNDRKSLLKYFDCAFLRKHGEYFIDYAAYTFRSYGLVGQAVYGRFDAAMDPETEQLTGIYEFNGDTPVMLFESVNLQDHLTRKVTGSDWAQYNNYYPWIKATLDNYGHGAETNFAVVLDTRYVDDAATCETLSQIIGERRTCFFADLEDIQYDYLHPEKPFFFGDEQLTAMFILLPWEEMVENWSEPFKAWRNWAGNVSFMEPAWRWFISHKGMFAYVTHLLETDDDFRSKWGHLPWLRTYLTDEPFRSKGLAYVSKPVIGRLSANVEIYNEEGVLQNRNEGNYAQCERVYQEFHAPGRVEGRNNFIVGMWMAPDSRHMSKTHRAQAATFCIREFDAPLLQLQNERFIPHLVV